MRRAVIFLAAAVLSSVAAQAQVTGVVTGSTVGLTFRPDENGNNIRQDFSGTNIEGSFGSTALGSGASYASTSELAPGLITFKNGNASTGGYAYSTSRSTVDISFRNDGTETVRPTLHSSIVPAGLGLFVGGPCQADVAQCGVDDVFPGDYRSFDGFNGNRLEPRTTALAGASFTFRILGNGVALYELTGSVTLSDNPGGGRNFLTSDLGDAAAVLSDFAMTSAAGSRSEYGFSWGETDLTVDFAPGTLLAPGEMATLTYETIVETYSRAECFGGTDAACIVAYSSFGDPVGRGGSPQISRLAASPDTRLIFTPFQFKRPVFRNGTLDFELIGPSVVPEPAAWGLMIIGFGLSGAMMRRRGRAVSRCC